MRYRKKPVEIEAIRYDNNKAEIEEFVGKELKEDSGSLVISTLEGDMKAMPGDYIIRGVSGEFYPCKPGIFEMTYEEVW